MLKKFYLSMLLFVACSNINAMKEASQQIPAPARKKLEIIRPSQQHETKQEASRSPAVIAQAITQRIEPEVPRVVPVAACSMRQTYPIREYIRVDASLIDNINNYPLNSSLFPSVRYYNEYHAQHVSGTSFVSFPLNCCDPLPLRNFRSLRFFFPSAFSSTSTHYDINTGEIAPALNISDPEINSVVAVRARESSTIKHIYIGYNSTSYVTDRGSRIYSGKILYIAIKDTAQVTVTNQLIDDNGATYIDLMQEIGKYLPNPQDCYTRTPEFISIMDELRSQLEPGIVIGEYRRTASNMFYSTICYWTKDENKLKGIHYSH